MKLEIKKLSKSYLNHTSLKEVSFSLPECKLLAIVGPSGGGKSTLLRLLAGLEKPDSGEIFLNGEKLLFEDKILKEYRKSIGIVFQSFNLFPHLTALENIALPLRLIQKYKEKEAEERARELLTRFGLWEHANKMPMQLSGGQQQRVAIIRAIAAERRLLLLDEPTSALDPLMTAEVLDLIMELIREGSQIILISHHLGFVRSASDWVGFLTDGKMIDLAPTQDFFQKEGSKEKQLFLEKMIKYT